MTKYYIAVSPEGHVFTRSSQNRTYTHMVVRVHSIALGRQRAEERVRADWRTNRKYYQEYADGTSGLLVPPGYLVDPTKFFPNMDDAARAVDLARWRTERNNQVVAAIAWINEGEEGKVQKALADYDAWIRNRLQTQDGKYHYTDAGWCSRPDLATKLAAQRASAIRCMIFPVREVTRKEFVTQNRILES